MSRPCENEAESGAGPVHAADEAASRFRDWLSSEANGFGIGAALSCPAIVASYDGATR